MRVVVVGGGPVGLFAATAAARAGLDVTLLEARRGDGDKACGEGLMPTAVAALESLDVRPDGVPFRGIRYLDAAGRHQVRADLRVGPGLGVRRTELVRALRAAATSAGVATISSRVTGVEQSTSEATVHCADGPAIRADVVLGCDGLASTVRRAAGLERPGPQRGGADVRRFGLVGHFDVAPWSDDVEVYWAAAGEAYVTPVGPRAVGVALLGTPGRTFGDRLRDFPALTARLRGRALRSHVLGAGPLHRTAAAPSNGRVLLVGDAAGYVDALTGEGLAIGFRSAQAAVRAATTADLESYAGEWGRITRRFRWGTELLLRATRADASRRALLPVSDALPAAFAKVVVALT